MMIRKTTAGGIGILAAALIAGSTAAPARAQETPADANEIIANWPAVSQEAANAMIEKYGPPDEMTETLLIWRDNGPWVRTIVYGYEIDHDFPVPHKDVLEQTIHYDVPAEMFDELAAYDGSVIAERTKGELSARCDKEGANILALNLANDIIEGEKSVEEARAAYAAAIKEAMAGNPPEIMQALNFDVPEENITNTDVSVIEPPVNGEAAGSASALFDEITGADGDLTVAEWDAAVDARFGEQAVNLDVAQWDADGDGTISRVEFEDAFAQSELSDLAQSQ